MSAFAVPLPGSGGAARSGVDPAAGGPQLYAGATNANGASLPVPNPGARGVSATHTGPVAVGSPGAPSAPAPPSPGAPGSGLSVNPNPGSTGLPVGAPGTNTGTLSGLTPQQAGRVEGENTNYFGQGVGSLLTNYLQSGAGYNGALAQQTINATDNAFQQQINQQYGGLQTSLSNAGLSPNSSASALASGQFFANASAQENQIAAQQYTQMYQQSQSDYLSVLQTVAGANNYGTLHQTTALGAIGAGLTGGLAGVAQYEGGAAGTAGDVTSTSGLFGGYGSSSGSGSAKNDAGSLLGLTF